MSNAQYQKEWREKNQYGKDGWRVDHIIPVSKFNYTSTDDESFKTCWALPNLQPMWGRDNMKKNTAIISKEELDMLYD